MGGGMSVEDAAILSSLLGHCTSRNDIPLLLKVYDDVRVKRCCDIVAASREQGRLCDFEIESIGDDLEKIEQQLDSELRRWMWAYEPEEAFKEALKKCEAEKAAVK
jgi:salicylate hydroxylase